MDDISLQYLSLNDHLPIPHHTIHFRMHLFIKLFPWDCVDFDEMKIHCFSINALTVELFYGRCEIGKSAKGLRKFCKKLVLQKNNWSTQTQVLNQYPICLKYAFSLIESSKQILTNLFTRMRCDSRNCILIRTLSI